MNKTFTLKYEIKFDEETNRPYISFSKDNIDYPEHKFMAIEITRYLLLTLLKDNQEAKDLTPETELEIAKAEDALRQIADEIAHLIKKQNDLMNDLDILKNDN